MLKWTDRHFVHNYRVPALSTLYLIVLGIILPSFYTRFCMHFYIIIKLVLFSFYNSDSIYVQTDFVLSTVRQLAAFKDNWSKHCTNKFVYIH